MHRPRVNLATLFAVLMLLSAPRAGAADVVLAKLAPATAKATVVEIQSVADLKPSPLRGKAHAGWVLQPGEALKRDTRPGDRIIELYTGGAHNLALLCRVWVRYFPRDSRWIPQFQLIEEPAVALTAQGWKPVVLPQGTPLLIAQTGGLLANAEGFKPALEFGLVAGTMSIDAWWVR